MNPLDPNTLEQLAGVICDTDGPHHRQYWQLEKFFTNVGWFGVPPYDESGRERWTRELLLSRREDPASMAQVIRRLADPREYPDDPDSAVAVAERLNRILAFEGLQVSYLNGRPELVERDPAFRTPPKPPRTSATEPSHAHVVMSLSVRIMAWVCPPTASQIRTVLSPPAEASQLPSGATATATAEPVWPCSTARCCLVGACQTQ